MDIWISFLFHWSMIEIMHFFLYSNFDFSVSMHLLKILYLFFYLKTLIIQDSGARDLPSFLLTYWVLVYWKKELLYSCFGATEAIRYYFYITRWSILKGKRMDIWISFLFHWSMIEIMHFFLLRNVGFAVSMYLLKILFLFFLFRTLILQDSGAWDLYSIAICLLARCTILLHLVLITLLVRWGQIYGKLASAQ